MDSRNFVRDSLLLLLLVPGLATTMASQSALPQPAASAFPVSKEVIPGKLKVTIFLHDVPNGNETISCWSYVTEGLWTLKQKDLIFTVRRDPGQKPEDYPHDILDLLKGLYHFAEEGRLVDVGSLSLFDEHGFMKQKDLLGIGYIEPERFRGVQAPQPLLAGIFLKGDEAPVALVVGLTRVTNLLGKRYRYYPCPPWSDLKRSPVLSRKDASNSVLMKIPKVSVRASYYEQENHIFLSLFPPAREKLEKFLGNAPPEQPLALLTNVDNRANASMVWTPGQKDPMAISPEGSIGSRRTGNFLALVSEQKENTLMKVEDGYSFFLTSSAWRQVRLGLKSGTDVSIPAAGPGGAALSIEWVQTEYTSPVTGESYGSERWTTYHPDTPQTPTAGAAVSDNHIVLLTGETDIAARTTVEELVTYIRAIQREVESYFQIHDTKVGRSVAIHVELDADGKTGIRMVAQPEMDPESSGALQSKIAGVPAAKASGPVRLEVIFTIRGGPGN